MLLISLAFSRQHRVPTELQVVRTKYSNWTKYSNCSVGYVLSVLLNKKQLSCGLRDTLTKSLRV